MDSYRGQWGEPSDSDYQPDDDEDDIPAEAPPVLVGQDERRMQVRAYNHWTSLLGRRNLPTVADLDPENLPGFASHAVLLDVSKSVENPAVTYVGARLAEECNATRSIRRLSDVPGRSLLSRITDHYMQILANAAPIGFEAEFVNQHGHTILYRGILLPFSDDDRTISHILGVINWKELADQQTTDRLLREIDRTLETPIGTAPAMPAIPALPGWADGPAVTPPFGDSVLDLTGLPTLPPEAFPDSDIAWPSPAFGASDETCLRETPLETPDAPMSLADRLAVARAMAEAAHGSEDRTRHALYAAIGRAWDFALAAAQAPDDFAALVAEAGITVQARAPMTPIVKLVFGADYDKTRLTEYAATLMHAQRIGLGSAELADWLAAVPGGLKGVVQEERRLKRDAASAPRRRTAPSAALARRLRGLEPLPLASLAGEGDEFTLLVARRTEAGMAVLGEVSGDGALLLRAAKKLVNEER